MNTKRIYALFLRQIYLLIHNPMRFINIFLWGILDIVVWGFLTQYLDSVQQLNFSFVPLLLGAVVLWNLLIRVQQGVVFSFFEDIWSRNFLNLFASPLKVKEYVAGLVLTSVTTSIGALVMLYLFAILIAGFSLLSLGSGLLVFLIILFAFGTALGVFAAAMGLRFGPSAEWVAWTVPFLLMPFSGIYYPVSALPDFLEPIARVIPTSYAFEGMRNILLEQPLATSEIFWGIGLALFYLLLTYGIFVKVYKKVLRNGQLARFSAEGSG